MAKEKLNNPEEEIEEVEEQEQETTAKKPTKLAKAKAKAAEVKQSKKAKTAGVILLTLGAGLIGYFTGKKKAEKDEELDEIVEADNDYDETEAE